MKPLFPALLFAACALAQPPQGPRREPLPDMNAIAAALGVQCEYCHQQAAPAQGPRRIEIARQMIAMTRDLNEKVQTATAKAAGTAVKVECATCHRGVAVPRPLGDVLWETRQKEGIDAAVAQYRDLRTRYYGKQAYDFGEQTLLVLSQRIANARPDDAIAFAKLNIEFHPQSSQSYQALAFAYTRKIDDESAIAALEKAVELEPNNAVARGQLEQLKSYRKR